MRNEDDALAERAGGSCPVMVYNRRDGVSGTSPRRRPTLSGPHLTTNKGYCDTAGYDGPAQTGDLGCCWKKGRQRRVKTLDPSNGEDALSDCVFADTSCGLAKLLLRSIASEHETIIGNFTLEFCGFMLFGAPC